MKAIIYARFSPRRNAEESESINVQFEKCAHYCVAMGYEVVAQYHDKAKSGKDRLRKGLDDAIAHAKELKAVLVVRDLSRLSRDVRDSLDIRDELLEAGAALADLEMKLDTTGPMGKCIMTVKAAFDCLMRETTAIKTSEAMLWKQKNGQRMSHHCPYGWKDGEQFQRGEKTLTKLEKEPEEQKVIARIVKMRAEGLGMKAIANKLEEENAPCRGEGWHCETIRRILKRESASENK